MTKTKIFLTGGHAATTAISVVQEIKSRKFDWEIYFAGVKLAIEGKSIKTLESEVLPKYGVNFLPLTTGRIQRKFTVWTIPSILKIPVGFVQALYYLFKINPSVVLSFGGFASVPVVVAAKLLGKPIIIHEQTAAAGRANLFAAKFADVVALSREESLKYFPKTKIEITGNPVTREIASIKPKRDVIQKTIFVTGGSRGSQSINSALGLILPKLLSKYRVIQQTGELDEIKFEQIRRSLPKNLSANYIVFSRVEPRAIAKIYEESDLVIARAGANTVSDIVAAGKRSILIPLPISFLDEQTKNAKYAARFGKAVIISQKDLNPTILLETIETVFSRKGNGFSPANTDMNPDLLASGKIVDLIMEYVK